MSECRCRKPLVTADPRHKNICGRCAHPIKGPGISTDETAREFFDRLEAGIFPIRTPAKERRSFHAIRKLAEDRERAGRDEFGVDYLSHDWLGNVSEEIADVLVYLYLRDLRTVRETGGHDGLAILLQACRVAIGALETASQYQPPAR